MLHNRFTSSISNALIHCIICVAENNTSKTYIRNRERTDANNDATTTEDKTDTGRRDHDNNDDDGHRHHNRRHNPDNSHNSNRTRYPKRGNQSTFSVVASYRTFINNYTAVREEAMKKNKLNKQPQ